MAKKQTNDDLLTGGSLSAETKSAKKTKSGGAISIAPQTKKIIKSVICVIIVVAILAAYVATGAVRKGFIASLSIPAQTLTAVTVSNGDQKAKVKVSVYNFYFATQYNTLMQQKETYTQYGLDPKDAGLDVDFDKPLSKQEYTDKETNEKMSWSKHMEELTLDAIEDTYTYYLAAVEANDGIEPEITEEQQSQINDTLKQYKETANKYGFTLSGYLVRAMGKGVTESVFRTETTRQYIASNYKETLTKDTSTKTYSADEISKYIKENEEDIKAIDVRIFDCANEDDAKEFASKLKADGSNFAELASSYTDDDFEKKAFANDGFTTELGVTRTTLIQKGYAIATADSKDKKDGEELSYPGLDWLFSSDRKAGEIKQYSTTVVYIIEPASLQDRKAVNVRHILVSPVGEDSETPATEATDKQWSAAEKKAKQILNDWNSNGGTEKAFSELAKSKSTDTGSQSNGGLYEDVIPGQMVNSFSAWCFDKDRKTGDTGIVMTDYGYHIMYFVGEAEDKVCDINAQTLLAEEESTSETKKLEDAYTRNVRWFASRYFEKDVDIDS